MATTLIPQDEEARLAAVRRYDVLDTPPDGAFDRVTALAARHFGVPIAIVSIVDSDRIWFKSAHGLDVAEVGRDAGLCASAILQDGPWIVEDAAIDPRTLANPLVAGEMGLRFYAGVPLTTGDGHNLGTLCLIDAQPRELDEDEAATLADMARIVMDQLELRLSARATIRREHDLREQAEIAARALQQGLLPATLPDIDGVELASLYRPAHASQVGGDFYDVFALSDGGWALVVGDVSGKGPPAAALTALARHAIRTASLSADGPAGVLELLNRAMLLGRHGDDVGAYCTAHVSFMRATADGFAVTTASAGHPLALVARVDGGVDAIEAKGSPAGWHEDVAYVTTQSQLAPGDVLLLYTDGLSEARRDGTFLGAGELSTVLAHSSGGSADGVTEALLELLSDGDVDVRDDVAALVVKLR
jgi:phosphoserine phosphatase RsbU/P